MVAGVRHAQGVREVLVLPSARVQLGPGGMDALVTLGAGDMRRTLNILQVQPPLVAWPPRALFQGVVARCMRSSQQSACGAAHSPLLWRCCTARTALWGQAEGHGLGCSWPESVAFCVYCHVYQHGVYD